MHIYFCNYDGLFSHTITDGVSMKWSSMLSFFFRLDPLVCNLVPFQSPLLLCSDFISNRHVTIDLTTSSFNDISHKNHDNTTLQESISSLSFSMLRARPLACLAEASAMVDLQVQQTHDKIKQNF